MVAPAVLLATILWVLPLVTVGGLSFFDSNLLRRAWVGFKNYVEIWGNPQWQMAVVNSFVYAGIMIVLGVGLGLLIALPASGLSKRWQNGVRTSTYLPYLAAGVIIGQFWLWVFRNAGLANYLVGLLGIAPQRWLGERWLAVPVIGFVVIMSVGCTNSVFLLAALEGVPKELREAARMDGCGVVRTWFAVDVPFIWKMIVIEIFLAFVGGFGVWETPYMLTQGGPEGATASTIYAIWTEAFTKQRYGIAATESIALLSLVAGVMFVVARVRK